jgi:hypothetical protein
MKTNPYKQFYENLRLGFCDYSIGMAQAILETPKSEMADFELALRDLAKLAYLPLLKRCEESGLLKGDWRRARVRNLIAQIQKASA